MILVELQVPATAGSYDFELDEGVAVHVLLKEILAVISQKEHSEIDDEADRFSLYSLDYKLRLDPGLSLEKSGIVNGHRLMLL